MKARLGKLGVGKKTEDALTSFKPHWFVLHFCFVLCSEIPSAAAPRRASSGQSPGTLLTLVFPLLPEGAGAGSPLSGRLGGPKVIIIKLTMIAAATYSLSSSSRAVGTACVPLVCR